MKPLLLIPVVALGVLAVACTSGREATTTTAELSPTTSAAPTTTTSPATTTSTTTTTLKPTVELPEPASAFGYRIEYDTVVSQPGSTDIAFSSVIEGTLVDETDRFDAKEWFGSQLVRDASYVLVGNDGWLKEDRKPWRELPSLDVLAIKAETIKPTDFGNLYDVVNTLEWRVEPFNGRQARVYRLPTDRAGDLGNWLPRIISRDLIGVDAYELELWIDADSEYPVRMILDARGPESMFADGAITEEGDGEVTLGVVYEFLDIDADTLNPATPPELAESEAPDGYYTFESIEFGFRLDAPLDWTLFAAESYDGFEVPFSAAPSIDVPNDSYFSVSIEDLSASQGLRVDEYAELNLRFITPFDGEVDDLITSREIQYAGFRAWETIADIVGPDESFRVRTITLIDGSLGYSIDFYSWDGWYDIDIEQAEVMFDSFELFDPADTST